MFITRVYNILTMLNLTCLADHLLDAVQKNAGAGQLLPACMYF